MSDAVKIDKTDDLRALLSEVLPYEVPLWFSNSHLHQKCTQNRNFIDGLFQATRAFKPLSYRVKRTQLSSRTLSIMHPFVQLKVCDFYREFGDLMLYYCSKSRNSIRYPSNIASSFKSKYEEIPTRPHVDLVDRAEIVDGVAVEDESAPSYLYTSYFKYGGHSFLYKFFESYDYQALEKRFTTMSQVDVARCFNSIYSHSIGWATKSKQVAKRDIYEKGGFDREFDHIMQAANYRETNGIIIGPEVSRIFAEIILQEVDVRLTRKLEALKLVRSTHYDFRRYVDDFFIFTNSEEDHDTVMKALEEELEHFKLYLNDAKTLRLERPFITDISIFKMRVAEDFEKVYARRINENGTLKSVRNPSSEANRTVTRLKGLVKTAGVLYSSVSNYILATLKNQIEAYLEKVRHAINQGEDARDSYKWLLVDLELVFFVHAMDPRVGPTDKVARIVLKLLQNLSELDIEGAGLIQKRVYDLGRKSIEVFVKDDMGEFSVEILNMLLLLSVLDARFSLPAAFLEQHFVKRLDDFLGKGQERYAEPGGYYFLWVTLMLYIKGKEDYAPLRDALVKRGYVCIQECPDGVWSTETFLFLLDFISCPDVPQSLGQKLFDTVLRGSNVQHNPAKNFAAYSSHGTGIDWNDSLWLEKSLEKRNYKFPYE